MRSQRAVFGRFIIATWVLILAMAAVLAVELAGPASGLEVRQQASQTGQQGDEDIDYFRKWLTEDVVYIITPEEKAVFEKLTTPEEKENFIEQFWRRRNPNPLSPTNEFKDEHYRRIAYANEFFRAGVQGWRTDRGKIYIIHGPPDEIRSYTAGHQYHRPMSEGGGETRTYPFEVWRYRHLPGLGSDVELEFVDRSFSGFFQLAHSPWQKDLLLHVQGGGHTLAEELGIARRQDHPFFNPSLTHREAYPFLWMRAKDEPFQRWELVTAIQRPARINYQDLKQIVEVNVAYNNLAFKVREDYFKLNEQQVIVPVTLEWENEDLTFVEEQGVYRARVAVYGLVTTLTNEIVAEFEDDVVAVLTPEQFHSGVLGRSIYQKTLGLRRGVPCRLDLVTKDLNADQIGVVRRGLRPPSFGGERLSASPIMLSNYVRRLEDAPKENHMFVLGDLWIRPNLDNVFQPGEELGIYLQVYNAGIDQSALEPSLEVHYRLLQNGKPLVELVDSSGESVHFFSGWRIVLLKVLRIQNIEPGAYQLEVEVHDRLTGSRLTATERLQVRAPLSIVQAAN